LGQIERLQSGTPARLAGQEELLRATTKLRIALWATLIVLTCASGCGGLAPFVSPIEREPLPQSGLGQGAPSLPGQTEGGLSQEQGHALLDQALSPLVQDSPVLPPMEVISVELDANVSQQVQREGFLKCPSLDATLASVVDAPDPLKLARALDMRVEGDKIQVMLVIDGADISFLNAFGMEIGKRSGDEIQAFVPVDRLCDLANHERVLALYPPHQAVIQQ
jgi:hypothetical protein